MRKSAILLGLVGCALLATAVLADDNKQNDGPGMTMSQKVGTLFGLIDGGKATAPPPPPGMPAMGMPGTVRMPSRSTPGSNGMSGQSAGAHRVNVMGSQGATNRVAVDPSLPQPPQPNRVAQPTTKKPGTTATVSDAPSASVAARPQTSSPATKTTTSPKTSIVGASKQPLFSTATQATPTTSAAAAQPAVSSRRNPTGNTVPSAAAPAVIESIPTPIAVSKPIPVNKPDAPALQTPPPSGGSEPFVPSLPQFTTEPPANTTPSVASSSQPSTLPPLPMQRPAVGPIPVNKPETAMTVPATNAPTPVVETRPDVLSAHTSPELTVETMGPRKIAVGRESRYRVMLRNRGAVEARDVVVLLDVPQHAEIAELHGTSGSSTSADEFAAGKPLAWQIDVVPAKSQEELTLVLIPRRSEAFELGVRWSSSTPTARATVEVQEPKLALAVTGPTEVSYGEQRIYKLTVTNPGNGLAENVVLQLMPLSPGDGEALSHVVGNLRAGESNAIEVELTARQAGTLRIRAAATADGNLRSEAGTDVAVRRANLDVVAAAPRMLFAGVPGNYEIRVRNTGDDTAKNVRLTVDLPSTAKLLTTTPSTSGSSGPLTWTFDRIAPGSEQVCTIKCAWDGTGRQQLTIVAAGDGDLRKSAVAATEVQAVADLALDVIDTPGPAPVGQPVVYEIHVKNRGLKSAEGVDVIAYFSEGIEPEKAEGHGADIQPGMIIFKTMPTVGPGQERVLKVTARAQKAGNHRLRVEMQSTSPQTELSHEDATFFYSDEPQAAAGSAPVTPSSSPSTFQPQGAAPIRPTTGALPVNVPTNTATPIAPSYRTNGLR